MSMNEYDFYQDYQVPDDKQIYFGYKSLDGEIDISEELQTFSRYNIDDLIKMLKYINDIEFTEYDKGNDAKAGMCLVEMLTRERMEQLIRRLKKKDDKKLLLKNKIGRKLGRTYQHTEISNHWQHIAQEFDGTNYKSYTSFNAVTFLVIANALLWNINEADRKAEYRKLYYVGTKVITWLKEIL